MSKTIVEKLISAHDCETLLDLLDSLSADSQQNFTKNSISEPIIRNVFFKLFTLNNRQIPSSFWSLLALSPLSSLSFFTKTLKTSYSDISAQMSEIAGSAPIKLEIFENCSKQNLVIFPRTDEKNIFFSVFLANFSDFLAKVSFLNLGKNDAEINHLVSQICAASDLVLNTTHLISAKTEFFLSKTYFRFLAQRLVSVLRQEKNLDSCEHFIAKMITKLVLTGKSQFLWEEMVSKRDSTAADQSFLKAKLDQ